MPKNQYSDEFKRDAVALVESGIAQKTVVRDLGVSKSALQAWVRDAKFQSHGMTLSTDPDERREMAGAGARIRVSVAHGMFGFVIHDQQFARLRRLMILEQYRDADVSTRLHTALSPVG